MMAEVNGATRWQAYMIAAPQGSLHAATLQLGGAALPDLNGYVHPDGSTIAVSHAANIVRAEMVNRDQKADMLMTRTPAAVTSDKVPQMGSIWQMDDIFSARDDKTLPMMAFEKTGLAGAEIMIATRSFRLPVVKTDTPVMVAKNVPMPARKAEPARAQTSLVAYAAPEQGIEAPFDAVMGGGNSPAIAEAPAQQPKTRPQPRKVKEWLKKRKRGAGNQHAWMSNKLPRSTKSRKEQACLAQGIYFEARGEPVSGQAAVGQVILNRVRNPAYPNTICGVVYQNRKMRNRCQFSFACDGIRDVVRSKSAWRTAQRVAKDVTSGKTWLPEVGDATHYHATYVRPRWARSMKKTDKIGQHIFYRTYGGGWS